MELKKAIRSHKGICLRAEVSKYDLYNQMTMQIKKKIRGFMAYGDIRNFIPKIFEVNFFNFFYFLDYCKVPEAILEDAMRKV